MKKVIAIVLCVFTISSCGWLIIDRLDLLDIPANKNETIALMKKQEIDKRTDLNTCEKNVLKSEIGFERTIERRISTIAYSTQVVAFIVICLQFILLIFICLMPNNKQTNK